VFQWIAEVSTARSQEILPVGEIGRNIGIVADGLRVREGRLGPSHVLRIQRDAAMDPGPLRIGSASPPWREGPPGR
jgi:hypothetical protein